MRILLRMPNWIGDAVMATPAVNNLFRYFPDAQYTVVASAPVASLFSGDPRFAQIIVDTSKKSKLRLPGLRRMAAQLGCFDIAISFRNSVGCTLLMHWTRSHQTVGASNVLRRWLFTNPICINPTLHQVEIYNQIITGFLNTNDTPGPTELKVMQVKKYLRPTLGIAPGATYGDAKRWPAERFAQTAIALSKQYDLVIFGSPAEARVANQISDILQQQHITNFQNLAGKTSVPELLQKIAGLSLFITNDSGPMHIAGALKIPTIAIFGPTIPQQTSPWKHPCAILLYHPTSCAPCMKRSCPKGHHACMNSIMVTDVLEAAKKLQP